MKTIKIFSIAILLICSCYSHSANKQSNDTTACFKVEMDCESCKQKIEKNIAFEKGVKAIDVNLASKTVRIKFNKLKNNPELLKQAIEKLKYSVEIIDEK